MTRAQALAYLEELRWAEPAAWDEGRGDYDRIAHLLDTAADNATILARDGDRLAELTGIDDRDMLHDFVRHVRDAVLRRLADEMNQAEAHRGGGPTWGVIAGRRVAVVDEGIRHRSRPARAPQPARIVVPIAGRTTPRARDRRRRSAATSRTRSRSQGDRSADDPEADQLDVLEAAAA